MLFLRGELSIVIWRRLRPTRLIHDAIVTERCVVNSFSNLPLFLFFLSSSTFTAAVIASPLAQWPLLHPFLFAVHPLVAETVNIGLRRHLPLQGICSGQLSLRGCHVRVDTFDG